jgi:hypothetical protein
MHECEIRSLAPFVQRLAAQKHGKLSIIGGSRWMGAGSQQADIVRI